VKRGALIITGVLAAAAATAHADPVELRIATLAPDGSTWMKLLDKGAAQIYDKTNHDVSEKWYAGGVQGDERDFVRKMNLGQLDGAAITSIGLAKIDEHIRVLELPMMFDSIDELDYVAKKMWPHFQKRFKDAGFVLADRGDVGWTYFLTNDKVDSVDALKKQKLWLWSDDKIMTALYDKLGLKGVPLGVPEVDSSLTTGRINACYGSPLAAVALQWNTKVKFRTELAVTYGIGATVIKLDAFNKLSDADKKIFTEQTDKIGVEIRKAVRKDGDDADKLMLSKGVTMIASPPAMRADFDKAAQAVWTELAGKVYDKDELADVLKWRDEYRKTHKKP
jgi:TRAP-type C4-dicarboxylate transport system substrate-binding protein